MFFLYVFYYKNKKRRLYTKQGIIITNAIIRGNNTVQQKDINWSKRILGKEALTHIKVNIRIHVLKPKLKPLIKPKTIAYSDVIVIKKPPMNNITEKIQIRTILAYSAKKKNTNIPAECSVINPDTNSDSASAKSKGALLVSAIHPMKKIINKGNNGNIKYTIFCTSILIVKLRLFVSKATNNITELNINS